MLTSRRIFLAGVGAATLLSSTGIAHAANQQPKLVIILLRGGLDGLSAIVKTDDRHIRSHRAKLIPQNTLALDDGFAAHPALKTWANWFQAGEAGFVHAIAGPYRDRSHFKAQDLLETGATQDAADDGWLNRALRIRPGLSAISIGPARPLILQGAAEAASWSPPVLAPASEDTLMRLSQLYADDALFAEALQQAQATNAVAGGMGMKRTGRGPQAAIKAQMDGAGRLLAAAGGPDIAVLDLDGWDSHSGQVGQLSRMLGGLDEGLATLKTALGPVWQNTAIAIVTEFGRTVRENGGGGTDHGTAGVALLAGGRVTGGQHGDWPGLAPNKLYEGRDLYPANDMNGLFAGLLDGLYGFDRADLGKVFETAPRPMARLV